MRNWKQLKAELLKDKEVKKEYDRLGPRYEAISAIISARINKGISQKELAEKLGTKQSAIARFETGNINPSLGFLEKLSEALGYKLRINLQG